MIILAGAIILTLNNNGIINKASDAVEDSNLATIKELTQMTWAEVYAKAIAKGIRPDSNAMLEALREGVNGALENINTDSYGIAVTLKGVEVQKGWVQEDLTVKRGKTVLEIGDEINYEEGVTEYAGKWKILGAENGELLIMSTEGVPHAGSVVDYGMAGQQDYISGISDLNDICSEYGKGKGATGARSITVEDVNRVTGYDPNIAEAVKDQWWKYGDKVTIMWNGKPAPYYIAPNGVKGYLGQDNINRGFVYFDGEKFETSYGADATEANPIEITTITVDYYSYYATTLTSSTTGEKKGLEEGSKAYNIIFEGNEYWLASRFTDVAHYGFLTVGGGQVIGNPIVSWDGIMDTMIIENEVRAVVKLASDINITEGLTTRWDIQ